MESFSNERAEAIRLTEGLEQGSMAPADAFVIADKLDPVMIYFAINFLREKYAPGRDDADAVTGRVLELMGTYDALVKRVKEGEKDPVVEWFHDTYNLRDYFSDLDGLMTMIWDKLES